MPTASTAQILGNNESFEPYTQNLYVRRVLSGEFVQAGGTHPMLKTAVGWFEVGGKVLSQPLKKGRLTGHVLGGQVESVETRKHKLANLMILNGANISILEFQR